MPFYIILVVYATCSTVPLLTPLESLTNSLVQGTQYITNDQSLGAPTLHYMQVPATDPVLDPNEGPQVPGAPGLDSMFWSGGGVEQSMLHDHREELGWTGTLCLNGVRVHARALAIEAARNPYVLSRNFYQEVETYVHAESYEHGQKICGLKKLQIPFQHSISRHGYLRKRSLWCEWGL
jgi:hypothetical protein